MNPIRRWTPVWALVLSAFLSFAAAADVGDPLESLPIQDAGRVKPFDTFARESLRLVYGRSKYEDKTAVVAVFTWLLIPNVWLDTPVVEVRHSGLREALKISGDQVHFTPQSLLNNERVPLIFQELQTKLSRQEKLNPYFQAVQRLMNQLGLFQAIQNGTALRFVPDPASDKWKSVAELQGPAQQAFLDVSKAFVEAIAKAPSGTKPEATPELRRAVDAFIAMARAQAPEKYGDSRRIALEEHLNHFHPFMWAWICYLICLIFLMIFGLQDYGWAKKGAWAFVSAGLALHVYGMALRVYLAGRPPVSNMYEVTVWVGFGTLFFGLVLAHFLKSYLLLGCATAVALFCLVLTNIAPTVLDSSLQPLEPVLRDNFWLTTHVLIISISYAPFFLAFALGDVLLFYFLKDEKLYAREIAQGANSIYRAMQIGVVLLAAGTILGGVWADYSWGRFWGWDPKETWALISLLGYLALLHGRLVGWVKNFELASGAVVTFSLIIMASYGVNYVLGAGLHTYGFGAGGIEWVTGFMVLHLCYVAYVSTVRYGREKRQSNP